MENAFFLTQAWIAILKELELIIIITFQKVELLMGGGEGAFTVICATYFILLPYSKFNIW